MNAPSNADNAAWVSALRDAIDAGDESLYRQTLRRFLGTREGVAFIEALMQRPAALAVMRRSYRALCTPLGLKHPNDLVAWLPAEETAPVEVKEDARSVVSMALPYFRFASGWARAAHKDSSYAIALALLLFEPVVQLCGKHTKTPVPSVTAAAPRELAKTRLRETLPTRAHLTERA